MIKIYFDWNVLSQMQNGEHSDLKEIILHNTKLLIPFSTSHISDISSSYNKTTKNNNYINSDLEFISAITKDFCLLNNGKGVIINTFPPKELFEQNINNRLTFNDISLNGLLNNLKDNHFTSSLIKPILETLRSLPIEDSLTNAFKDPKSAEIMEKILPGLKENPTIEGFFNAASNMYFNLNEKEGYKDLRQILQTGTGIKRDKIFDTNNPFEFIEKSYNKLKFNLDSFESNSKNAPKWFNEITNTYIKLDMHGYQEDKINIKKGRKETFKNTTEDAFHAAFASTCNFYIINDNKSFKKTKKVYEELSINTRVFKPNEFLEFYVNFLEKEKPYLKRISEIINSDNFHESVSDSGVFRAYCFQDFIFGFFNKIIRFYPSNSDKENSIMLTQNKPTNWFIIEKEVDLLMKRMILNLGIDSENEGELKKEEFSKDKWFGRKWVFNDFTLRLLATNGHVQLYLDMENTQKG
jgi:hypothetical protein